MLLARQENDNIKKLVDYVIKYHYPELLARCPGGGEDLYLEFAREVIRRTAKLYAHWQAIGFVHGVLNTDNNSILGLTIDYGPYGFMENYSPQ